MKTLMSMLGVAVAASAVPLTAHAQQAVPHGGLVTPSEVKVIFADGTDTGWVNYKEALSTHQRGLGCGSTASLMYDAFGADTDGITAIGGDTECGLAGPDTRNLSVAFEDSIDAALSADDVTIEPGFDGGAITRITGAYYHYGDGNPANTMDVVLQVILVDTAGVIGCDQTPLTAGGVINGTILGSLFFSFPGSVNNPGFYNTFDIDVCAIVGNSIGIPSGLDSFYALQFFFVNGTAIHTATQPMLWGTDASRPGSTSGSLIWRDLNQDLEFTPGAFGGECVNPGGACPDQTGTMLGLWGVTECDSLGLTLGDVNNDGSVDLLDVNPWSDNALDPNDTQADLCTGDYNGDGVVNNFDKQGFINAITGG